MPKRCWHAALPIPHGGCKLLQPGDIQEGGVTIQDVLKDWHVEQAFAALQRAFFWALDLSGEVCLGHAEDEVLKLFILHQVVVVEVGRCVNCGAGC